MTDAHTHPHMHACLHWYPSAFRICTHTHTHIHLYPHPPPGLIHLLHLRMWALWCHLQSHHFKGSKALQCHQHREQTRPLASSFVPLSPNGNSPAESPHMDGGELQHSLQSDILRFLPTGIHRMNHNTNDKLSLFLFSLTNLKENVPLHETECT